MQDWADDDAGDFTMLGSGGFSTGKKSKLSSLFGTKDDDENQSLGFKPKSRDEIMNPGLADAKKRQATQKDQKFAAAGPVNVFAYPGGVCKPMGQQGMAIVEAKQGDDPIWVIFIYTSSNQPITQIVVSGTFEFKVLENNYCGFYDMKGQYWTVSSDLQTQYNFAQAIGMAKVSQKFLGSNHPLVAQNLNPEPKEGQALKAEDKCIVKLDVYLPSPYHPKGLGQNIYSEASLKLKLSSGKPIPGVCEGCLGMKVGSQRMLILPPNKAWGAAGNPKLQVPANSSIVVVVHILKAKFAGAKAKTQAAPAPVQQQAVVPAPVQQQQIQQQIQQPAVDTTPAIPTGTRQHRATSLSKIARMAEAAGVKRMILPGMKREDSPPASAAAPASTSMALVPVEQPQVVSPSSNPADQQVPQQQIQPVVQQQQTQQIVQPQHMKMQQQPMQPMQTQPQIQQQMRQPMNQQMQNQSPMNQQMQIHNQPQYQQQYQQQVPQHRGGYGADSNYGGGAMYEQQDQYPRGYRDDRRRFDRRASPSPYSVHSRRDMYDRERDFDNRSHLGGGYRGGESDYTNSTRLLDLTRKVDQIHAKMNEPVLGPDVSGVQFMKTFQTFYKEYETNKSNVESLTEQVETLRGKNRALHEKNQTLIEKNSDLMEAKFSLLSNADAKFNEQISRLQQEKDSLSSRMGETDSIIASKDAELGSLRAELESLRTRLEQSETMASESSKALESLKTDQQSGDEIRAALEAKVEAANQEKESLQAENTTLSTSLEKANKEVAEMAEKINQMNQDIERLKKIEATQNSQTEELNSMRSDVAKSRAALTEMKMKSESEIERLKEELDSFRLGGDGSTAGGVASSEETEKLKSKNTKLEEEILALQSSIQEMGVNLEEVKTALEQSQSETQSAVQQGRQFKEKLLGRMEEKQNDLIQRIMGFVFFQATEHLEVDAKKMKSLVKMIQKTILQDPDGFDDDEEES